MQQTPALKHLLDLGPADCRWPVGDPRKPGFGFCGAQKQPGRSPYCAQHTRLSLSGYAAKTCDRVARDGAGNLSRKVRGRA